MTKSTVGAVSPQEVQLSERSMGNSGSKQMDDDCVSEDSIGSDFDNATDDEKSKARLDADTELDLPPAYSENPQSKPLLANMELELPFSATPSLSGPSMCVVCHLRPRAQKAGKVYPTCGLTCAAALKKTDPNSDGNTPTFRGSTSTKTASTCVICLVKPCCDGRSVTCGMKCTMTLCTRGSFNSKMCDYCHRRPKFSGHNHCGITCRDNARTACLLCRSRPRFGRYHLCGRTCKTIASKWTPLILEVRPGHATYNKVEQMFKRAWKGSDVPSIIKVYKVFENKSFLLPFDRYKRRVGNEVFRYHGTSRRCTPGSLGNTRICPSTACALCSILRTSFRISQSGPFGAGIYSSFAANEAYKYSNGGKGAIILSKVVLGTEYKAKARHEVKSCPPGYNSVVFSPQNEKTTVVYTNDAIRPVFLIIF